MSVEGCRTRAAFRMRPGLRKIDQNPHSGRSLDRQVRCALASPAQDDQLLLEQEILRHHRAYTTGATDLRGHDGDVKQGEQEVPHLRVTVGQTWGAAQRCRILDSAREFSIRDAQTLFPRSTLRFNRSASDSGEAHVGRVHLPGLPPVRAHCTRATIGLALRPLLESDLTRHAAFSLRCSLRYSPKPSPR